jgi:tetratricopeptide (TPR) repeat protein
MIDHPDPDTLLRFAEDDPSIDRVAIAAHIEECERCAVEVQAVREMLDELARGEVLQYFLGLPAERARVEQSHHFLDFKRVAERRRVDAAAAEEFFPALAKHPVGEWLTVLRRSPEHLTIPMADRILDEAELLLNERPAKALRLIDLADALLNDVDGAHPMLLTTARGDVWRQRSNAHRHLFQLQEAVNDAILAEHMYRQLENPEFSVALAQNTRAVALFKMTRLNDALDLNLAASTTLRNFGPTLPFAKSLMFEAGIRLEQGFIAKAQGLWRQALLILEPLSDPKQKAAREMARCLANLAECSYRLGDYADAAEAAAKAMARYQGLRMETEAIRSAWTLALCQLHRGDPSALDALALAAEQFEALQMFGDAGFVRLDIAEELLRREEWGRAEPLARQLVGLFTRAGVTLASVQALDYLRQSVIHRLATTSTVQYVRDYVMADDPTRPFAPPGVH